MSNILDGLAVLLIGNMTLSLMATTVAIWGVNAALWACPVTWIIAAIGAIAVGAYFLVKNWKTVSKFFGGLWDWLKKAFPQVLGFAAPMFAIPMLLIKNWKPILAFFVGIWNYLKDVFKRGHEALWNLLPEWFRNVLKGAAFIVKFGFNKAKEAVDSLTDGDGKPAATGRSAAGTTGPQSIGAGPAAAAQTGNARVGLALDLPPGVRTRDVKSDSEWLSIETSRGIQSAWG